ncbi:hypothetical protein ACFYT4_35790 [Streptomyces sp. NPDC004609]|uniref:hypothetical protein n=1 Tax=Streptomyces sp. NPDC004609 TaxID=3364704 RepID=UPI0036C70421
MGTGAAAAVPGREPAELKITIHAVHVRVSFVLRSGRTDRRCDPDHRLTELATSLFLHD